MTPFDRLALFAIGALLISAAALYLGWRLAAYRRWRARRDRDEHEHIADSYSAFVDIPPGTSRLKITFGVGGGGGASLHPTADEHERGGA